MKVLIVYESKGPLNPLDRMAAEIAEGVREEGCEVEMRTPEAVALEEVLKANGLILGTPSHYGSVSARMKGFLDRTYEVHGKLDGKVGAAFTTSRHVGGGNETTLLGLHMFFLIHGMVVQGDPKAAHYGPFVVQVTEDEDPIVDDEGQARRLGQRVARLVKKLGQLGGS
jgi:NAD(P)H dehydrogenase (quinone)